MLESDTVLLSIRNLSVCNKPISIPLPIPLPMSIDNMKDSDNNSDYSDIDGDMGMDMGGNGILIYKLSIDIYRYVCSIIYIYTSNYLHI